MTTDDDTRSPVVDDDAAVALEEPQPAQGPGAVDPEGDAAADRPDEESFGGVDEVASPDEPRPRQPFVAAAEEWLAGFFGTTVPVVQRWSRWIFSTVVVGACCAYVLWILNPSKVFLDTTPTGGDMGAHVWGSAYLRDELLPNFRLSGWSPDWYSGFPAYTYYMVVPSLFIVALDVGLLPWWSFPLVGVIAFLAARYLWQRFPHPLARFATSTAVTMAAVLSVDVPYNIAFKLVASAGCVAFPAGVWWLGRGLGLRRPAPELMAMASVFFLSCKSLFSIYGGNIASTMAGEFAFALSLTFAMFFLGTVARGLSNGRHRALAAGLFFLTATCHVIPTFFAILGAVVLLALRPRWRSVTWLVPTGVAGGLSVMFWYAPFLGLSNYLNDMGWEKIGRLKNPCPDGVPNCVPTYREPWNVFVKYLLPFEPFNAKNNFVTDPPDMFYGKVIFILAAVGILLSIVLAVRAGVFLGVLALIAGAAFRFMPQQRFWNARVLPFYYLMIYLLAGLAVWLIVRAIVLVVVGRWTHPSWAVGAPVALVALLVSYVALGMTFRSLPGGIFTDTTSAGGSATYNWLFFESRMQEVSRGWAGWNFSGYERRGGKGPTGDDPPYENWNEFKGLVDGMAKVGREQGCGRALWEYTPDLNKYGTTMAPMLLPYYTNSCIGSQEGLYFEASSTTPYHFLMQNELSTTGSNAQRFDHLGFSDSPYVGFNLDLGIRHMQLLGVRYYLAYSEQAKTAAKAEGRLTLVGSSGPWEFYRVADSPLVEGLANKPAVYTDVTDNIHQWAKPSVEWFMKPDRWDVFRASSGPADWPRVRGSAESASQESTEVARVSDVRATREALSFKVDRVGTPVLVKVSYFPNWKVEGAEGPYRVAPNLMVVVPTSNSVQLSYGWSPIELIGWALTLVGFVLFGWLVVNNRRWAWTAGEWAGDRGGPAAPPLPPVTMHDRADVNAEDGGADLVVAEGNAEGGGDDAVVVGTGPVERQAPPGGGDPDP